MIFPAPRLRDLILHLFWSATDRVQCALGHHLWNKGVVILGARVRRCERPGCGVSHVAMDPDFAGPVERAIWKAGPRT